MRLEVLRKRRDFIGFVDDVIALEGGGGFVAADAHDDFFGNAALP